MATGHCEHGEFNLLEGCPKCIEAQSKRTTIQVITTANEDDQHKFTAPEPLSDETREVITAGRDVMMEAATEPETALALRPGEDIEARDYHLEATKLLEYAETRTIKTLDDAKTATNDLSIIGKLKKAMEAKRKDKLEPSKLEAESIRETYNYLMEPVLEAEKITKQKQTAFLQEQQRIEREQAEINRKRMEAAEAEMKLKGELTESVNLVEVQEAPSRVQSELGTTGMTDHWKYEVTDILAIPREYLVIDSAMLNAIAKKHHDQKPVAGIRFYNEPYLATRTR